MIQYGNISVSDAADFDEPVILSEVKTYLKEDLEDDANDSMLESMIVSARQDIESEINLALIAKGVSVDVETTGENGLVRLPYAKGVSNVEVNELDSEDAETLLSTGTDYFPRGGAIRFPNVGRFTVSYTVVPQVDETLKEAIKMLVAYRYNNRGDQEKQQGLPEDIKSKVSKYQEVWL